jgi:hypothetical protein
VRAIIIAGVCVIALFISVVVERIVLDSPDRDIERWHHELSMTLPEEATKEEVIAWLSTNGMEPKIVHSDDGQVNSVWASLHRDYFLYWDGELEFSFSIGKTGMCSSRNVEWSSFGP